MKRNVAIVVTTALIFTPRIAASAQEPANPVAFTVSCTIPSGQTTCNAQVSLPAGKRFVLEHVSAKAHAPSGHTVQLQVGTSSPHLPGGTIAAKHFVVLNSANDRTSFASQPLRMYATSGSYVSVHGQRISYPAGAAGTVQYDVYFTGFLTP